MKWLSQKLAAKLRLSDELDVEWKPLPWSRLLPSLSDHEVDMVISSMTRTAEREKSYKGVRFTEGYYVTHQILVSRSDDGIASLNELDGSKTVGTLADTTNQKAARALAVRFGFQIRDEYLTFDDLYSALDSHSVDAALVDDVFVKDKLASKRFRRIGRDLDDELKRTRFYSDVIGHDQEAYAIAVSDAALVGPKGGTFLDILNELLRSKECRTLLDSQKEKLLLSARADSVAKRSDAALAKNASTD